MAKVLKYNSLAERFASERDATQLLLMLIAILEDKLGPFFEEGCNKLYPAANDEPHPLEITKPQ